MHRSVLGVALAALIIAGCESAPTQSTVVSPSFDKVKDGIPDKQNEKGPFSRILQNPCPPVPELVAVEGTSHFHSHFKFFEGGNTLKSKANVAAKGIGLTTGVRYSFHEQFRLESIFHESNGVFDSEQTTRWHVVSATDLGNFFATSRQRVTCDATGACTVQPIFFESDCRG